MERKHYFILRSLVTKYGKDEFGWFEMDTIVDKDLKSVCLVLIEQLTKFEIVRKLKERYYNWSR